MNAAEIRNATAMKAELQQALGEMEQLRRGLVVRAQFPMAQRVEKSLKTCITMLRDVDVTSTRGDVSKTIHAHPEQEVGHDQAVAPPY